MKMQVEVSLYPLGKNHLSSFIDEFADIISSHHCDVEMGPMSTMVEGDSADVFAALRDAYEQIGQKTGCVLIVKASNACPQGL